MNTKGILLVVSGFAGSGKGTLMKEMVSRYDNYALSVSATTRNPRPGEQDGREYFFVTKEKFENMIEAGELLEYACYVGNYYGTPRRYVEKMLDEGKDVILEIETQGGLNIKKIFPEALLLFVMPPSVEEIYNRLKGRGTETEEIIMERMTRGADESFEIPKYDYLVINDEIDECVTRLHNTVQDAKYSTRRNMEFIEDVQEQFKKFLANKKGD